MKIGITCYPSHGGSGVVATELGKALADRGHEIHFITYDVPFRLANLEEEENIFFHQADPLTYPLFKFPPYVLALSTRMWEVAQAQGLDLLHVHYAIPHATSAYLAKQMARGKLKIITTLHGTDITLVGIDASYREIVKFSIENSDGVTAVSNYLRDVTYQEFKIDKEIEVIYNFVDPDKFKRANNIRRRRRFAEDDEKIVVHVSNFRPVKRIPDLVNIFAEIVKEVSAKLVLVGDGPDRALASQMLYDMGLRDETVFTLHNFPVQCVLSVADIFLLPSQTESFGLAALEAMSCETPVVASRTGGLPEVVEHGKSGFLAEVGDVFRMADYAIQVLKDDSLRQHLGKEARKRVISNFPTDMLVSQYERYYEEVLGR